MSCEVIILQLIFYTKDTPEQYYKAGTEYVFPKPETCLHPNCQIPIAPKPHGYYSRNVITINFSGRILIRRYYCKYCGHTFSYLPSFCLPYFQYAMECIFISLFWYYSEMYYLIKSLATSLHWHRQHLQFYRRRFMASSKRFKLVLRQLLPQVNLPEKDDMKKGAQKLLHIVLTGFPTIQTFSTRFFAQCNQSFMAPSLLA